jgi:hypothetical protein
LNSNAEVSCGLLPPAANEQREVNVEKADNWPNIVVDMANRSRLRTEGVFQAEQRQ